MPVSRFIKGFVSSLVLFATTGAYAQSIASDPILQQAIARQNWEPGGKYFGGFDTVRGSVRSSSRTGKVSINPTSSVQIGNFLLQNASISGQYGFVAVFSGHPYTEHSPFNDVATSSDEYKSNPRADGSQTSYSLHWTGTQVHPADGYDGPQGGGYPTPRGARDVYQFSINGSATGIYFTPTSIQYDAPSLGQRLTNIGNNVNQNLAASTGRIGQGIYDAYTGLQETPPGSLARAEAGLRGTLEVINGVAQGFWGTATGLVNGAFGSEISYGAQGVGALGRAAADRTGVDYIRSLTPEKQYEVVGNLYGTAQSVSGAADATSQWLAEHPIVGEAAETAGNVLAVGAATKFGRVASAADTTVDSARVLTQAVPDATSVMKPVAVAADSGATSVNAAKALANKLSALEDAQANAARVQTLSDGRIRYYEAERSARNPGPSRGASYVTEWNPASGSVRSWNEVYDHNGSVIRVHPKMIDGQAVDAPHYPPTAQELGQ